MKPIIMTAESVRAILAGNKTQTRRVIKPQYAEIVRDGKREKLSLDEFIKDEKDALLVAAACAPYQPGDVLWVREAHSYSDRSMWNGSLLYQSGHIWTMYKADGALHLEGKQVGALDNIKHYPSGKKIIWNPSIHMPRAAARIFLRVTGVRVERVQEISSDDCLSEGISTPCINWDGHSEYCNCINNYSELWDAINAKRGYGWDENPWVWVYEFERISKEDTENGNDL